MSQNTARPDPHAIPEDDVEDAPTRQLKRRQAPRPNEPGEPHEPHEPDESEPELIGDDDLSPADLGPAAPDFTDPDAGSGRARKIAPDTP